MITANPVCYFTVINLSHPQCPCVGIGAVGISWNDSKLLLPCYSTVWFVVAAKLCITAQLHGRGICISYHSKPPIGPLRM